MGRMFRYLRPDEIDVRVARVIRSEKDGKVKTGVMLLFYKDARVDQNILDEKVGPMNWQRSHGRDNANCIVSIWDDQKKQWISKEDTGTESNTEKEKGLASDSFKRACFNWGIARELYTAPTTMVWGEDKVTVTREGKCYDRFRVTELEVVDGTITHVVVVNESKNNKEVFRWDMDAAYCNELELSIIEAMWSKHCSGRDMKSISAFRMWPKVTKKTYADFMAQMKGKLENGTSNEGKNQEHSAGVPQSQDSGHAGA